MSILSMLRLSLCVGITMVRLMFCAAERELPESAESYELQESLRVSLSPASQESRGRMYPEEQVYIAGETEDADETEDEDEDEEVKENNGPRSLFARCTAQECRLLSQEEKNNKAFESSGVWRCSYGTPSYTA